MAKPMKTIINVINRLQAMPAAKRVFGYTMCIAQLPVAQGETAPSPSIAPFTSAEAVADEFGSNSEIAKAASMYFRNGYYGKPKYFFVGKIYEGVDLATQLIALFKIDANYYTITCTNDFTDADKATIAARVETVGSKIGIYKTGNVDCYGVATTDLGSVLKALNYNRAMVIFTSDVDGSNPAYVDQAVAAIAATVEYTSAKPALVLDDKELAGIVAEDLLPEQYVTLESKNINYYTKTSEIETSVFKNGVLASGYYFDTIQNADWIGYLMKYNLFMLKRNKPKIPFTAKGFSLVAAALTSACITARNADVIGSGYDEDGNYIENGFDISMPELASISLEDKANRYLQNVSTKVLLSGAIQTFEIVNNIYL